MDIVLVVVILIVVGALVGGAVLVLRSVRTLPLDRYAVVSRRWGWPYAVTSRQEYLLRRTRVVPGGQPVWSWPWWYRIEEFGYVKIPPGTVGLVSAKIGADVPASRELAEYVECARFQDAAGFLDNGGEQGVQPELLRGGGEYAINPLVFDVYTVDDLPPDALGIEADDLSLVSVHSEDVGVVIVTNAPPPDDLRKPAPEVPGHNKFQEPWVFLANGGRSGPQAEILPGGAKYAINPVFARVVHIPTRVLSLKWQTKSGDEDRYDSELAPLRATIQGHGLEVELTQTLSIPPHAAPILVKQFGEDADGDVGDRKSTAVKRFVGNVLGQKVKGYFTERTSSAEIEKFVRELADVREKLKIQITVALAELQVEAYETNITEIRFTSDELNREYREYVREQQRHQQLEQELRSQHVINAIDREKLKVHRERLAAQEQVLIALFGRGHREKERILDREVQRVPPTVIVAGGATSAVPIAQPQPVERIAVPAFDPTQGLDVFDISPGVLPAKERTESGDPE
jgi:hypothetical protein